MRLTYHITPMEVWDNLPASIPYAATSLADEGFIHCTDGAANMVTTANRHYRSDPRPYYLLTIDLEATGSPWRFDHGKLLYPHIYGPVNRTAVLLVQPFPRRADGEFLPFVEVASGTL